MRFTFHTGDDRLLILKIFLDQDIHVPESGDDPDQQQEKGEIRLRAQFPVQP